MEQQIFYFSKHTLVEDFYRYLAYNFGNKYQNPITITFV